MTPTLLKGGASATLVDMNGERSIYTGTISPPLTQAKLAGATIAKPPVKQLAAVPDVHDWSGSNIQCVPDAEIDRRIAAGEPRIYENVHPLAEKAHSYYPVNIAGYPRVKAKDILDYLDPIPAGQVRVNGPVWRDPFNLYQLAADGTWIGPGRKEWLDEWIENGGRVIGVHMAQENESPDFATRALGGTAVWQRYLELTAEGEEANRRYVRMIKTYPAETQKAFLAQELRNENAYPFNMEKGEYGNPGVSVQQIRSQFEDDIAALARAAIDEGLPDHMLILFPKYRYNASAAELLEVDQFNQSMFDRWKDEFGNRVGISMHLYPGWKSAQSVDGWRDAVAAEFDQFTGTPQVVTEMNSGSFTDSSGITEEGFSAWAWPELAARGLPLMVFPVANWGPGSFFATWGDPDKLNQPDRFFTWGCISARSLRSSPLDAVLPLGCRRSTFDPLYDGSSYETGLRWVRPVPGSGDVLIDHAELVMWFGDMGTARTITIRPQKWAWVLCGGAGDTVDVSAGVGGVINTGDGADTILLGAANVAVYGGKGADTFIAGSGGAASLHGFKVGEDMIQANGNTLTTSADAAGNLLLTTQSGGTVRLLGVPLSAASAVTA